MVDSEAPLLDPLGLGEKGNGVLDLGDEWQEPGMDVLDVEDKFTAELALWLAQADEWEESQLLSQEVDWRLEMGGSSKGSVDIGSGTDVSGVIYSSEND